MSQAFLQRRRGCFYLGLGGKEKTFFQRMWLQLLFFIFLQSTSPSHAVVANVQHVLHLMKQHSKVLCNDRVVSSVPLAKQVSSRSGKSKKSATPPPSSSINEELAEVLETLQDEFGQMSL